jgi:peptide-methionine (S)-S-oxide reductase
MTCVAGGFLVLIVLAGMRFARTLGDPGRQPAGRTLFSRDLSGALDRPEAVFSKGAGKPGIKAISSGNGGRTDRGTEPSASSNAGTNDSLQKATFGAGCFWCVEAVFQGLKGVESVVSGYSGGTLENPTYVQVCFGESGHAEVVQISYDPTRISYADLLQVFWGTHDPTTPNRQGNDVGTQYRSAIFYHNDEQRKLAEHYKQKLDSTGMFSAPIITEIVPFRQFFAAEDYHQDFYERNARQPYCQNVIQPKLDKLTKVFADKLKVQAHERAGGTDP